MVADREHTYLAALSLSKTSGVLLHAELIPIAPLKLGTLKPPAAPVELQVRHVRHETEGTLATLTLPIYVKRQSEDQCQVQRQHFESI